MDTYIGIGFVILCLSILVFVAGLVGYTIRLTKEKLDVSPSNHTSSSNTMD